MFDSNCSQYRQISAVGPHIVLRSLQLLLELTELSTVYTFISLDWAIEASDIHLLKDYERK